MPFHFKFGPKAPPFAAATLLASALLSCNTEPTIYITLSGWPQSAVRLRVATQLDGQLGTALFVEGGRSRFSIHLPPTSDGNVKIEATALDRAGCDVAVGSFTVPVPHGLRQWTEQTLALSDLPSAKCPPSCTTDGWCMPNPLPQSNDLLSVWGTNRNRAWALGNNGTALRWDGSSWMQEALAASALSRFLDGVWGQSAGTVWVVGADGAMLQYDGSQWTLATSGTANSLYGIWGSASNDIWAVGNGGTTIHWDGSQWKTTLSVTSSPLTAIWGTTSADIWAVGSQGVIVHWEGSQWKSVPSSTAADLRGIWGTGPRDIWAVGNNGTILHWDGYQWDRISLGITTSLYGVWGSGPSDIWAIGDTGVILHSDGAQWVSVISGTTNHLRGIWGSSASEVWGVGFQGTMLQWTGTDKLFDGQSCSLPEQCRSNLCSGSLCGGGPRGPTIGDACATPAAGTVSKNLTPLHCIQTVGQGSASSLTWRRQDRLAIICTNYAGRVVVNDGNGSVPVGVSASNIAINTYQLVELGQPGQAQRIRFPDASSTSQVNSCQVTYRGQNTSMPYIGIQLTGMDSPPNTSAALPGN